MILYCYQFERKVTNIYNIYIIHILVYPTFRRRYILVSFRSQLKSSAEAAIINEQSRALQGIPKTVRELKVRNAAVLCLCKRCRFT